MLVSQNSTFNGLVGIGTNTPGEKLHVAGNIKADNTITSSALNATTVQAGQLNSGVATFSDNVSVSKDVIVTGKLGVGVPTPSESLDINGNLKLTGAINASSINANQGTFTQGVSAGNTSINGILNVTGQLSAQSLSLSDINATNNVAVGKDLTVTGQSQLKGGVTIVGTTTAGDVQVNGVLNAKSISITDVTTTGNAMIGKDINVTGKGLVGGDLTVNGKLNAQTLSLTDVTSTGNVSIGQNLTVSGSTQLNGTVNTGAVSASSITTTGNIATAQDLNVSGNTTLNNLTINGQLTSKGFSADGINTQGSIVAGQNLSVSGATTVNTLQVTGAMNAGVITATDFKKADGTSLFNFDNTVISQTLNVAADHVPSNYKMAVGGNIIVTGVDVKIPQKWPDYVFTDRHKLLTLDEVNAYIKEHGHLPGVLSAAEMQTKQNYSLSEMDAKLLEKVEELTLYIIELKKEIEALKKK